MKLQMILSILLLVASLSAQDKLDNLVIWEAGYNKEAGQIEITATISDDWVIYSQHTPEGGPIPLEFEFEELAGVEFVGEVEEGTKPISKYSEMFEIEVLKFKETAIFTQKIKTDHNNLVIKGTVTFMTCDSQRCLPPKTIPFEVKI